MAVEKDKRYLHGRGAQINPVNPYEEYTPQDTNLNWADEDAIQSLVRTTYIETHPKTIVNKVDSPDLGMMYSMNPYQGCEHGCIYCYARNTHPYWGYSAGLDFESKILYKKNAPALLEAKLKSKNWKATAIMLSGNTDCYQPVERQLRITRQMLEVLWKYRHPVGIITKNSLILRDLDILTKMSAHGLVHVALSITTLDEKLRQVLEPRTAAARKRLKTLHRLSESGIPTFVMMAPIIPSLNDHEIFKMAETVAKMGALSMNYTIVRLNGDIGYIFRDWLRKNFPDRYERVIQQIKSCHDGSLRDSRFGIRMRGEGHFAELIANQFKMARKRYFADRSIPPYDFSLYEQYRDGQLRLF